MSELSSPAFKIKVCSFAAVVFFILISAQPLFPDFFGKLESVLYDQRVRLADPVDSSDKIVLLNIDDASLRALGKWPWDREVHAKVIDVLTKCEVGVVVYDIVFHGEGTARGDALLLKAIKENGKVILPAGFGLVRDNNVVEIGLGDYSSSIDKSVLKSVLPNLSEVLQADRSFLPLVELANVAKSIGHISASPDSDGVLRRVPLAIGVNGLPLPSVDLKAAMHVLGADNIIWKDGSFLFEADGSSFNIPVDAQGRMAVNFAGKWGEGFSTLSFQDVYAVANDPEGLAELKELVRGKAVVLGLVSSGSTDMGPTPVGGAEPLVTIHSNAINTILQRAFIRVPPVFVSIGTGVLLVCLVCGFGIKFGPRRFVLTSSLSMILYVVGSVVLYVFSGVMLNLSGVLYVAMSCFLVTLGFKSLLLFAENEARRIDREKIQIQLDAAARIQSHFWPKNPDLGDGNEIFAMSSPALFVGGDFYDIIELSDGSYIIYLADVSGKGLPAALVMASAWTQIRSLATLIGDPDALLTAVNEALFPFLVSESNFITVLLLRYFPQSGKLQYVNAGHMQPIVVGPVGSKEVVGKISMPLGVFEEAEYTMSETVVERGESCIMMSDGVTEAENLTKELFGDERVMNVLVSSKNMLIGEKLAETVRLWRNGAEQNDDTTIVEIRRS